MATPKLRFKEFDEDWSKTTLSDIAEINPPSSSLPDKFIYIDLESVKNGRLLAENNIELKNAPSRAQRLLQKDDVLFQVVRPYQQNNLYFEKEGSYVASTGYAQIRAHANSSFLYHMLHEEQFLSEVINRCTGTSYPAINSKDLSSIEVYTPSLKEQTKIATFLSAVDSKIDELIQKHELLTDYKKGMMQQLFSQKLRFKADDGSDFEDWEETNLGEVCSHFKSGKSITSRNISTTGKFAVYGGNGLRGYTDSFTHEGKFILVGRQGALCGNVNLVDGNNYISEHAIAIQANKNNSTDWLAYWLDKMKLNRFSESSAQAGLAVNKLVKFKIELPSLPEQTKIANFLTVIDQKIDNVAEQIDHAKTWKKGLLQQMFV